MPIAYSYQRFSRPEQADGDSLRRQHEFFDRVCRQHKLTPAASYAFIDHGKSGSRGRKQRDLERFVQLVEADAIPSGSWLIVENLDRLSRRGFEDTYELLKEVLQRDIVIVPGEDEPLKRASLNKSFDVIKIAITAERAWQESHYKSIRCSAAWQNNLRNAAKEKVSKKGPAWLDYDAKNDQFTLNKERAKVIREIYKLCIDKGMGQRAIAAHLNARKAQFPAWQTGKHNGKRWASSYIQLILTSRTVLGEFTTNTNKKRDAATKPQTIIKDYYPAVIDKATFNRAKSVLNQRTSFHGKTSKQVAHLFAGLAKDKHGNQVVYIKNNAKYNARWTIQGNAKRDRISFPYEVWEQAFIDFTKELTLKDIGKEKPRHAKEVEDLGELITDKELRIAKIQKLIKDGDVEQVQANMQVVGELSRELQQTIQRRDKLIAEQHRKASADALSSSQSLAQRLATAKGEERIALRLELRQAIRDLIQDITVDMQRNGTHTYMTAEIAYRSGEIRRIILVAVKGQLRVVVADSEKWKAKHGRLIAKIFGKEMISNLADVEEMLAGHNIKPEYDND